MTRTDSSRVSTWISTRWGMIASGAAVLAVVVLVRAFSDGSLAEAKGPGDKQPSAAKGPATKGGPAKSKPSAVQPASAAEEPKAQQQFVANVNGENISRVELTEKTIELFGGEVLQNVLNRQLIVQACKEQGITITVSEVDQEIDRLAQRFGLSSDRYLSMLKEERGVTVAQYAKDIIWPMLALRKLSQGGGVSEADLQKAFEAKYGPSVKARLIAVKDEKKARDIQAKAAANPDQFPALAKQFSDDASASLGGIIQPIHMHLGDDEIERVAFRLQPGQVSGVLKLGDQFIILKCDKQMPQQPITFNDARKSLEAELREGKERQASNEVFKSIHDKYPVKIYYKSPDANKMPGVVATINDRKITTKELGEACVDRRGQTVLDGLITRKILEQACKRQKVTVAQADIDEEVARAARSVGASSPDGKPLSVEAWLKTVTDQQGISVETYLHDAVWPSVALKKLVHSGVKVEEEDLHKGFEANYGKRVRCLAIVFNNQRKAQEVWQKARDNDTADYFGELAEQYSIEESSRLLHGEVPPIQRHGGQPVLEKEAFALNPGELSSVITMGDKFVILRCVGYTEPVNIKYAEAIPHLTEDIYEKKLRIAMSDRLEKLKAESQIDNYLANTSHAPEKPKNTEPKGSKPTADDSPSINGGPRTARQPQSLPPQRARGK